MEPEDMIEEMLEVSDGEVEMADIKDGVEIDSDVADDPAHSAITEQVEMGVAVRMACLDILTRKSRGVEGWS